MAQPDTSSAAGAKQQYKSLLNQHAQKIWKQLPVYQTFNEGAEHSPKFRSTVVVDGVGYTSPNTFTQRKMAEMDASRIAFFGSLKKLKNEASRLVLEDRSLCKSALVEYATRMIIQKPTYQTRQVTQLGTTKPVFRSSVAVAGVSCTGESSRNKKEAEQSAARVAALKCLDSESGYIMSEIINCKFKHSKVVSNTVVPTGGENVLNLNETKVEEGTKMPSPAGIENGVKLSETKVEGGTKMPSPTGVENSVKLSETKVEEGTKIPSPTGVENDVNLSEAKVEDGTQMTSPNGVKSSLRLNETKVEEATKMPSPTGVENGLTLNEAKVEEETKVPSTDICFVQNATIPAMHSYVNLPKSHTQKVSAQALTTVHTVLPKSPSAGVPTSCVKSEPFMVVNHPPSNVVQVVKSEESSPTVTSPLSLASPAISQPTFASTTCGKKRSRNNSRMAQKKMCVENQSPIPAVPLSQVPSSSAR